MLPGEASDGHQEEMTRWAIHIQVSNIFPELGLASHAFDGDGVGFPVHPGPHLLHDVGKCHVPLHTG